MQYYNNTLSISYGELVDRNAAPNIVGDNAIISRYKYVNLKNAKKLITVRMGCRSNDALYAFDSLPMDIRQKAASKYKDVVKTAQQEPIKKILQQDYKALSFFTNYTLPNGNHLKENTIREYTATAVALNTIIKLQSDTKAWRQALGGSVNQTGSLSTLLELLDSLQSKWGWKLPAGERAVRGKLSKYRASGYESIISGKLCNENAAKVVETEQEAALRRIMAVARNFDDMQVTNLYNMTAQAAGWKKITKGTVANKRSEWQMYADAGSRGKSHHDNNTHAMQHNKRRAPKAPLLYWTVDGWDVELLYQKVVQRIDSEGKVSNRTEYHHRLTAVVVLDPCGKYPIGYAIGTHETPALIRQALRNAVSHTKELFGEYHHVHQLQTDRYGKGALTPFYEAISETYTPARAHNAKAKVIEPYFKHLNKNHCQIRQNWSGFGVTARKENQPNAEFLNKIQKSHPDQDGCIQQIIEMIEAERKSKVTAYLKAYENLSDAHKFTLSQDEVLHRLGETSTRNNTNKLYGHGVPLQINKQKYVYDTFDPEFRHHRNQDWILRYDPANMSQVLATNDDGSLRFMLEEKFEQPMALAERQNGDAEQLSKVNQFNKAIVQDILDTQENDFNELNDLFNRVPSLQDTLAKLLLVDSNGQHKDNKSHARLMQQANKKQMQIEQKAEKQNQKEQLSKREAFLDSKIDINDFLNTKY
ncbi:hypothetical protein [Pedobacter sp. NJ-S-72]